ncbi:MAG: tetratricopeptide repeat protein [Clostridium lundense]|nr:tetratricopeptide repeat protein [Clostridium lundense]
MTVVRCKMCGGDLELTGGEEVATCLFCGTKQTLPKVGGARRASLYDRANRFRCAGDFDKAAEIFEQAIEDDPSDAEAYWSLVLCRYGIEYVEDPSTHKRIPTINRVQRASILQDVDYECALERATAAQRPVYESEAAQIAEIQAGMLEVSAKDEPYDVFICYKETDDAGRRTRDSVLAGELYQELVEEGFRVFFSRVTLEDKLGDAYEPHIFAALSSAKVMVVLGTRKEHFEAPWVRNEWGRYLRLIAAGEEKALIPAFRDMDPYDLPEEFAHLQAQDMSKLGFMQDLVRGIKKILGITAPVPGASRIDFEPPQIRTAHTNSLLRRAFLFLEEGEWERAKRYCNRVLDQEPENALAYVGELMAELKIGKREDLPKAASSFRNMSSYRMALRFGDEDLRSELTGACDAVEGRVRAEIKARIEQDKCHKVYVEASAILTNPASSFESLLRAADCFERIGTYRDAERLRAECLNICEERARLSREHAERFESHKEHEKDMRVRSKYAYAYSVYEDALNAKAPEYAVSSFETAARLFGEISSYKDSLEMMAKCRQLANEQTNPTVMVKRIKKNTRFAFLFMPACVVVVILLLSPIWDPSLGSFPGVFLLGALVIPPLGIAIGTYGSHEERREGSALTIFWIVLGLSLACLFLGSALIG